MFTLRHIHRNYWIAAALACAAGVITIGGCASSGKTEAGGAAPTTQLAEKGGAQLWAETCSRCHNLRSPGEFRAAEWDVIVHHMRFRADLTGEEQRKILDFLKSAS